MNRIRRPILLIGSPRSGTTLLGSLLAKHPSVAYWEEPRTIWSQGKLAWREDDRLTASDLSSSLARRIDDRFGRFLDEADRERFAEKTPSNTLRLPFIHALYPDARVVHLVRDGRAVVASMGRLLNQSPDRGRLLARLRETSIRDLPALIPLAVRDLLRPGISGREKSWWGPRPPGWRDWNDLPRPVRLARQWKALVAMAREDLREVFPEDQWLELRYEDLVTYPEAAMTEIEALAELAPGTEYGFDAIRPARASAWRDASEADAEIVAALESEAGDLLRELGYPPS